MSKLSQETIDKIAQESDEAQSKAQTSSRHMEYGNMLYYLKGIWDGYNKGATEWAGRAEPVIDFLEEIGNGPFPINQKELEEWLLKTKRDARAAIAKYKEATNG